jgi:hypothetical protein
MQSGLEVIVSLVGGGGHSHGDVVRMQVADQPLHAWHEGRLGEQLVQDLQWEGEGISSPSVEVVAGHGGVCRQSVHAM